MAGDESNAQAALTSAHRAFLHKNYVQSLLESERGLSLAKSEEAVDILSRTVILRYTVAIAVFTHPAVHERVLNQLKATEGAEHAASLLNQPLGGLVASLWSESLSIFSGKAPEPASLEPTPETSLTALALPTAVISSAIFMALRADMASQGTSYARQLCEWYFGAVLAPEAPEIDMAQYQRVLRLYAVHVLGAHMHDWDYARSFVGYSRLTDEEKEALVADIDATQARIETRVVREREAAENAQRQYESKARSSKEEHSEREKNEHADLDAHEKPAEPAQQVATTAPVEHGKPMESPKPAGTVHEHAPDKQRPSVPPAAPSGTTLKRTTSISARRPDAQNAHDYLARRPNSDLEKGNKPDAPAPEASPANAGYTAFNTTLRNAVTGAGTVILLLLVYRGARRARIGTWLVLFLRRLWDTLRMYVYAPPLYDD